MIQHSPETGNIKPMNSAAEINSTSAIPEEGNGRESVKGNGRESVKGNGRESVKSSGLDLASGLTPRECRLWAQERLKEAGVPEPEDNAWQLLSFVTGYSRSVYYLHERDIMPAPDCERFSELVEKRAARIPLQQLTGTQNFMGFDFKVNEHVLIPRQDTEVLVETAWKELKKERPSVHAGAQKFLETPATEAPATETPATETPATETPATETHATELTPGQAPGQNLPEHKLPDGNLPAHHSPAEPLRILDICTGSGCIGISLAVLLQNDGIDCDLTLADISTEALQVTNYNVWHLAAWHLPVHILESDLFDAVEGTFDVITANPPYIPTDVIEDLMPEVKDHEPRLALDGTADGLLFYRRIATESLAHMNPGGHLYLEIGYDQAAAVTALLQEAGWCEIRVIKDLAENDRVVTAQRV